MKEKFSVAMETATGEVKASKDETSRKFTHIHTQRAIGFGPIQSIQILDFNGEQICNGEESLQGQSGFLL